MDLFSAASNTIKTDNGDVAYNSTTNPIVDLFYIMGASRKNLDNPEEFNKLINAFAQVYKLDQDLAASMALYTRDARGGLGERATYRAFLKYLASVNYEKINEVFKATPEVGRWDDLLIFFNPPFRNMCFMIIEKALKEGNSLCAKWMPRKGPVATALRQFLKMTPRAYRKMLVNLTNVVETKMCAKEWDNINFEHVPSLAMARYSACFANKAPEHFNGYKEKVNSGQSKINTATLYPYDIIKTLRKGDVDTAELQWKNKKEIFPEDLSLRILPVIDVSGSMSMSYNTNDTKPIDIAIGLGLALSERLPAPFTNKFITFSATPEFINLSNCRTLEDKYNKTSKAPWGMNTNIDAVFTEILSLATKYNISEKELPTHVVIVSDMQFDMCGSLDLSQRVKQKYSNLGYTPPTLIFWNVNGARSFPTLTSSAVLLSGASMSSFISYITSPNSTPVDYIKATVAKYYDKYITDERYS
jgi:hypothetical protein